MEQIANQETKTQNKSPNIEIRDFSKLIGLPPNKFFEILRRDKYLMSQSIKKNHPYSQYNGKYFKMVQIDYQNKKSGQMQVYFQTLITPEGQVYFKNKYGKFNDE